MVQTVMVRHGSYMKFSCHGSSWFKNWFTVMVQSNGSSGEFTVMVRQNRFTVMVRHRIRLWFTVMVRCNGSVISVTVMVRHGVNQWYSTVDGFVMVHHG